MVWGFEKPPTRPRDPEIGRRIRQAVESTASVLAWVSEQLSQKENNPGPKEVSARQRPRPEVMTFNHPMVAAVQAGMFDSGAWKWVLLFDDVREVFGSLSRAKAELLENLFWMARDVIDSDPPLYQEIMRTWEEVSKIREGSNSFMVYSFTVADTEYKLIRQDFES